MPRTLEPDAWRPVGVPGLEPEAARAVRELASALVVAGPGAGKTELLAQRACYLLQTGLCRPPRRILAISFKRDAASNLRERVCERCGVELARYFDSLTFDAFAKQLLDHFRAALPDACRPSPDYVIDLDVEKRMRNWLDTLAGSRPGLTLASLAAIPERRFYRRAFLGSPLFPVEDPRTTAELASIALWYRLLKESRPSRLDFPMIGRLAELLLRHNPFILRALRGTYAFVFLDEFQDTTAVHYRLARTAFHGSAAALTAVGDNKQRIMAFAGALDGIFERFRTDFGAEVHRLYMNYRSAPELVRIQRHLIAAFDPASPLPNSADDGSDGEGECRVLLYPDHEREAEHLAALITGWMHGERLRPRDVCVLTRNRPEHYTGMLVEELRKHGIKARQESALQDLLVEPLTATLLHILKLAVQERQPESWAEMMGLLREINGLDEGDSKVQALERNLAALCERLGPMLAAPNLDQERFHRSLREAIAFINEPAFKRCHPQYRQGELYAKVLADCAAHIWQCRQRARDWGLALTEFEGADSVPVMTMHKSKGLEYHTVVFVGLEDSALWGFAQQPEEEKCGFFVAFSRAKKRVVFTFSEKRPRRPGERPEAQDRSKIGVLYSLLQQAGVVPERIG